MKLDLTARQAEKLLTLMNVLLEGVFIDPDVVAMAKQLEQQISEQNQATAFMAAQYRQASLFPRVKDLPKA